VKILVLSDNFMPLSNAERVAYLMTKEYEKLGHKVVVITSSDQLGNGKVNKFIYKNIQIYQIGSSYNRYLRPYIGLYNPWVIKAIKIILKNKHFDFAHIHNIHTHISYSVISLLKRIGIKQIMTAHDYMSIDYGKFTQGINPIDLSANPKINPKLNLLKVFLTNKRAAINPFRNLLIKNYLNKLEKIITVSKAQELILNSNGIKNTLTINNGISEFIDSVDLRKIKEFKNKYHINSDEKVLLWAGRLSKQKGADQVEEVLLKLVNNNFKVKLLVAGGDIFDNPKLKDHIISPGWLNEDQMRVVFDVSDLVLVPSIYPDPFPTVVLEAMQSGTPAIVTCFGGASEAVTNKVTGLVINPFNIDIFYKSVNDLISNEKLHASISMESKREFNKFFLIDSCMKRYLDLIQKSIQ
jgi:glycosyltransferase involved in cell wall biosynthesis